MTRFHHAALVFVFAFYLGGCAPSVAWHNPDPQDAVNAAPNSHRVIYEDEKVRILDVTVAPGAKENLHRHSWPSVLVIDEPTKLADYAPDGTIIVTHDRPGLDVPLPLLVRSPPEYHSVENQDTIPFHLYRIEFKHMTSAAPPTTRP